MIETGRPCLDIAQQLHAVEKAVSQAKRVLIREDLNVPVKDGKVTDVTRLARLVPGLKALAERGAKVVVLSHFGRPKSGPEEEFSLRPVAAS